jgi:hypothetical protein
MTRHPFAVAVEAHDPDAIRACFAPDATLHSPATNRPFDGRPIVAELVIAARSVLADLHYTDQLGHDDTIALLFRATIEGRHAEGLDLLRLDQAGLVSSLTVMLRPLQAVSAFVEAMGPLAAKVVGPSTTSDAGL